MRLERGCEGLQRNSTGDGRLCALQGRGRKDVDVRRVHVLSECCNGFGWGSSSVLVKEDRGGGE